MSIDIQAILDKMRKTNKTMRCFSEQDEPNVFNYLKEISKEGYKNNLDKLNVGIKLNERNENMHAHAIVYIKHNYFNDIIKKMTKLKQNPISYDSWNKDDIEIFKFLESIKTSKVNFNNHQFFIEEIDATQCSGKEIKVFLLKTL